MVHEITRKEAAFMQKHAGEAADKLMLRYSKSSEEDLDIAFCCSQIAARRKYARKLPDFVADCRIVFPPSLNLEQSSSEATAHYKQGLIGKDETLADLTCGFGIDSFYFAQKAASVLCTEKEAWLSEITEYNFGVLGLTNCRFVCADVAKQSVGSILQSVGLSSVDVIYLDPSRRNENTKQRVYAIEDCSPDVKAMIKDLLSVSEHIIIKLSPMVDLKALERDFDGICDVHVLSLRNECKEVLVEIRRNYEGKVLYHVADLTKGGFGVLSFSREECETTDQTGDKYSQVGRYLFEPDVSLMKIGLFQPLIERYGVKKLHRNTHLFTSDRPIEDFFGRSFEVENVLPAGSKSIRNIKKANVAVRNFPQNVEQIRKQHKLSDGGDTYLFFAILKDESKVCIVCKKLRTANPTTK